VNIGFGSFSDTAGECKIKENYPYSELAEIYDHVMDHVDYISWANYISSIFQHLNTDVKKILEIACGTGNLSVQLHKLGYDITCTDISFPMLVNTAKKFRKHKIPLKLFTSHMTGIPLTFKFDAVICIYDSINYLTDPEDFIRAINEVSEVTRKGGLYIFDVCTVKNSEMFFENNFMVETFGSIKCERFCTFNKTSRIQENHFVIVKDNKRYGESHYQKIYKLNEIKDIIQHTDFIERGRYDDMNFMPGTEESQRVHFVLQKY